MVCSLESSDKPATKRRTMSIERYPTIETDLCGDGGQGMAAVQETYRAIYRRKS